MILLGSVQRIEMIRLLEQHLGRERRLKEALNGLTAAQIVDEKKSLCSPDLVTSGTDS